MTIFNKIAGTFTSKLAAAVLNFGLVILLSRFLGASGKGEASLFLANITIILLFTGIIGGTAIIYLTPRRPLYSLVLLAYGWSVIICTAAVPLFYYWHNLSNTASFYLWLLSLVHALFTVNAMVLPGKKKVSTYNFLTLLQPILGVIVLLFYFYIKQEHQVAAYYTALLVSYSAFCGLSFYFVWRLPDIFTLSDFKNTGKDLFRYGSPAQLANIISFINNRLSFYLLEHFISLKAVGVYSVGISLAEGFWLVGRSIALVQYTQIANTSDVKLAQTQTLQMARLSFWITVAALLFLISWPAAVYVLMFGQDFTAVRKVVIYLSPGVAAVSLGNIFIHYFSGIGKYFINTKASFVGLLVLLPTSFILIPEYSFAGAALAASLSQLASTIYLTYIFKKQAGFPLLELLPQPEDFKYIFK